MTKYAKLISDTMIEFSLIDEPTEGYKPFVEAEIPDTIRRYHIGYAETPSSVEEVIVYHETQEEAEERITVKERERLDQLTLTPADVERALNKSRGMDFEDLNAMIVEQIPSIDVKSLSIEFRAKDFYRGATFNGIRLFDVIGGMLGYTSEDMDYFFETKELPPITPED